MRGRLGQVKSAEEKQLGLVFLILRLSFPAVWFGIFTFGIVTFGQSLWHRKKSFTTSTSGSMVLADGAENQARLGLRHLERVLQVFGCSTSDIVQVGTNPNLIFKNFFTKNLSSNLR
jgi:hypothetical protein